MQSTTIEQRFGKALQFAEGMSKRGFQAGVCKIAGIDSANLNRIIKKGGGCAEDVRRKIVTAVLLLVPTFPAKTYDYFLELGQWAVDGNDPEAWQPSIPSTTSLDQDITTKASNNSQATTASTNVQTGRVSGKSSVTVTNISTPTYSGPGRRAEDSPQEGCQVVLSAEKVQEFLSLMNKVGNAPLLDKYISDLKKIEEIMNLG